MELLIPVAFGQEQTTKRQLLSLGYEKAPAENGRIELSGDNKGNVIVDVIPNEGYTFVGWTDASGEFKHTGSYSVTSPITLKAIFEKK